MWRLGGRGGGGPELLFSLGLGRPLGSCQGRRELFFASTRLALELVESYAGLKLRKREVEEGTLMAVDRGRVLRRHSFRPGLTFEDEPLPAVPAPDEARSCLERLAALHAAAS